MKSLSRKKDYRRSLVRNLATSLILYEKIKTSPAKAKAVKPVVERMLILAKKNDLVSRRRILGYFFDKQAAAKIFDVLGPRYKNISTGFIKSYRLPPRLGDGSAQILLQLKDVPMPKEINQIKEQDAPTKEIAKTRVK